MKYTYCTCYPPHYSTPVVHTQSYFHASVAHIKITYLGSLSLLSNELRHTHFWSFEPDNYEPVSCSFNSSSSTNVELFKTLKGMDLLATTRWKCMIHVILEDLIAILETKEMLDPDEIHEHTCSTSSNWAHRPHSRTKYWYYQCQDSPQFWLADSQIWFAQVEAQFNIRGITLQKTKFDHVITLLASEFPQEVRDLILFALVSTPFETLKQQLIEQTAASEQCRLQ